MSQSLVTQDYLDHFAQTPSIYTSCTNDEHHPETTRALVGWGELEGNTLSFAVSTSASEQYLSLAQPGNRVSLVSVTLSNYLTYQYKGTILSVHSSTEEDLNKINAAVDDFCKLVAYVGIDSERYRVGYEGTSYSTITFELDSVFDQTPRVGAGALLKSKDEATSS